MDKLKNFNFDTGSSNNDLTPEKETLEFQIYGNESTSVDGESDEYAIPDSLIPNEDISSSSFVQTPSSIRPTYVPRFTEVSENYRMQNDPRPRPKTDTHTVKAMANDDKVELDPTTERLEEREKHGGIENCLLVEQSECTQHLLIVCHFLWL